MELQQSLKEKQRSGIVSCWVQGKEKVSAGYRYALLKFNSISTNQNDEDRNHDPVYSGHLAPTEAPVTLLFPY